MLASKQVNIGSSYGERFGSPVFINDEIPTFNCEPRNIPDCLFSMELTSIVVSFNKDQGTIKGFRSTFLEINLEDKSIIDSYTCTHGDISANDETNLFEIEPYSQTYVEQMVVK